MPDRFLLDTNILVYAAFENDSFYPAAKVLRDKAVKGEIKACISPQNLAEFYSIVTSKKRVTSPISPASAKEEIRKYLNAQGISKIYIKDTTPLLMAKLAEEHKITGQDIYDVLLLATMMDNKIKGIYTANDKDFKKYAEIAVINPFLP
ncbi:MAG: type II toxin-antitoxin system VapC family toxin [Deltaproteobacteria bacterium]|nr:type II toxin-antitoxin system VapC family toxin [Deltaproteobacteria bacterium]